MSTDKIIVNSENGRMQQKVIITFLSYCAW